MIERVVGADDFGAQLQQVLVNLELALATAGASAQDVIKLTIYVVHLGMETHGQRSPSRA